MNLPNKLTVLRIILVPIMVIVFYLNISGTIWIFSTKFFIITIIFCIASLTDKLDGYLARKNNQVTNLGKFLDPIADKIMVIATMILLVEAQKLPAWIPIIIILREFAVSGYRLIAVQNNANNVIAANIWGKMKTVTQIIAVILLLLDPNPYFACITIGITDTFQNVLNWLTTITMSLSVIATIFSGYTYLKNGKELFKNSK